MKKINRLDGPFCAGVTGAKNIFFNPLLSVALPFR
jgi:hypothetical protein